MKTNHPYQTILRKKNTGGHLDIDVCFDLICAHNYFAGQFGSSIPVEENREVWQHMKKLIAKANHQE